jgi:chromosome segregation ATPase
VVQAVDDLAGQVQAARRRLDRLSGRAEQVAAAGKAAEADITRLEELADVCAKTAALLTSIGEEQQESARRLFEDKATEALRFIFDESLSFRLVPGEAGGQVTLEPVLQSEHDGETMETPVLEARGIGLAVVIGFVLQLVMVKLSPRAAKILFLDESFAFVSVSYRARLAAFLREAADRMGVQIVMSTHDPVYTEAADVLVRLAMGPDGVTRVFEGEAELCRTLNTTCHCRG